MGRRPLYVGKTCQVEGCSKPVETRSLCVAHYARLKRHGDPTKGNTAFGVPLAFLKDVACNHEQDCCLAWPYAKNPDGYGHLKIAGKDVGAHRYVCEHTHGPPPSERHLAAHSCGKGHLGCVAKTHLLWKTPKENTADRWAHGTMICGEKNYLSKLTELQVTNILGSPGVPKMDLAKLYGVTPELIAMIRARKLWKHVDIPSPQSSALYAEAKP